MTHDEEQDALGRLEQKNRARRNQNLKLRRALKQNQDHADALFIALCEQDECIPAKVAMLELWARGRLECGSEDYDTIVECCIEALDAMRYVPTHAQP